MKNTILALAAFIISIGLGLGLGGLYLIANPIDQPGWSFIVDLQLILISMLILPFLIYYPLLSLRRLLGLTANKEPRFANSPLPFWIFPARGLISGKLFFALSGVLGGCIYRITTVWNESDITVLAVATLVPLLLGIFFYWLGVGEEKSYRQAEKGACLAWWVLDEKMSQACKSFYYWEILMRWLKVCVAPVGVAIVLGWGISFWEYFQGVLAWSEFGRGVTGLALGAGLAVTMGWILLLLPNIVVLRQKNIGALFLEDRFCIAGFSEPLRSRHYAREVTLEDNKLTITLIRRSRRRVKSSSGFTYLSPEKIYKRHYMIMMPAEKHADFKRIQSAYQL